MPAVLHKPARRLGAEVNAQHECEGWDERRTELETPSYATSVLDNDVGAEAQEKSCGQISA
jgi:hypothetical protein